MEYEDYIKLKKNTDEEQLEMEVNFFSSGASPNGDSAAWRCEIITHDNDLWINREPYYYPFKERPDRLEVQRDFYTNRKRFKCLGNYYHIKEQEKQED